MKMIYVVLALVLTLASFEASAGPRCTQRPNTNVQFCVGDTVYHRYNYSMVGVVVDVFRGGYADVDWSMSGNGFSRSISVYDLSLRSSGGGGGGDYDRPVYDSRGYRLYVGAIVSYNYNEAIGTVDRVNGYSQTVDVNWNIRGSGYGRGIPSRDVTLNRRR